jgi:hypothetical protein
MPEPSLALEISRLHKVFSDGAQAALTKKWMNRFCLYAALCHFLTMFVPEPEEFSIPLKGVDTDEGT